MSKKVELAIPRFMVATSAFHVLDDIGREKPSLCLVEHEDDDNNYYGKWVEGLGLIDVRFPKQTTRELTIQEINGICNCITNVGNILEAVS